MAKDNMNGDDMVALVFAGVILLVIIWYVLGLYSESINTAYAKFKIYETWPYMFWSGDWNELSSDILADKRDLSAVSLSTIGAFYNRAAAIVWAIPFAFVVWKLSKLQTVDSFRTHHTPQSLLATTSRIFSPTAPWVYRDITKVSWNAGKWRLMESPLMFLIRNRAILDPNGEPFRWNVAYDCGDAECLYAKEVRKKEDANPYEEERSIFEIGIENSEKRKSRLAKLAKDDFTLPARPKGSDEEEKQKFLNSDLVPTLDSVYLNSQKHAVINSLDEERLRQALIPQVGERLGDDPFVHFRKKAQDAKEKWRYGLATALFLHGFSDKTKDDAKILFDQMNYSYYNKKPMRPEDINVSHAMKFDIAIEGGKMTPDRLFMDTVMQHAVFANVFFMALLMYSRQRGVVSTASFGWVKAFDRTLWYALNQTGRAVCSVEAAGAWSHYFAEVAVKGKLETPYMEIAIEGIRTEMIIEGYLNREAEKARAEEKNAKLDIRRFQKEELKKNYGKTA